jgi:hypothetical protein
MEQTVRADILYIQNEGDRVANFCFIVCEELIHVNIM